MKLAAGCWRKATRKLLPRHAQLDHALVAFVVDEGGGEERDGKGIVRKLLSDSNPVKFDDPKLTFG